MAENLKQKLSDDLKQALRDRNKNRLSTLRLLLSAVQNAEIARRAKLSDEIIKRNPQAEITDEIASEIARKAELAEADIFAVIAREIKQRQDSIEAFKQGNRQDLVEQEEAEMAVLKEYLPAQVGREEIAAEARRIIQEVGAQSPRDKGKVMPKLMAQYRGRADGKMVNEVVSELLGA